MCQQTLAIWSLIPLPFLIPFLNPTWASGSSRFMYCWSLGLENFEHYFASMWNECNYEVVWTFFGIAFLWDWNENWPFPILWQKFFQICWHIECSTLPALSFRIWNSLAAIPSFPLAFFIVMLPKTQMTSHSRISGSRWVITPLWLSGSWRFFCIVLLCILATSS